MKRIIKHSMFLVLMLFSTVSFAQVEQTNADTYFYYSKVENAKLILYASSETFANLSQEQKTYILADKLQNTNYDEIVIYTNYGRELWFRKNGTLTLADSWDMNSINIERYAPPVWRGNTQKNFFVSGNLGFNIQIPGGDFTALLGLRTGTYLFKEMFDVAAFWSFQGSAAATSADVGLSARAYWPIQKIHLKPFVGLGVSRHSTNTTEKTATSDVPFYLGTSWFVGGGSFEFCFQTSKNTNSSVTIGYTFCPQLKRN